MNLWKLAYSTLTSRNKSTCYFYNCILEESNDKPCNVSSLYRNTLQWKSYASLSFRSSLNNAQRSKIWLKLMVDSWEIFLEIYEPMLHSKSYLEILLEMRKSKYFYSFIFPITHDKIEALNNLFAITSLMVFLRFNGWISLSGQFCWTKETNLAA